MRLKIHKKEAPNLGLDWAKVLSALHHSPLVMEPIEPSIYFFYRIDIIEINEQDFPGSDPSTHGYWISEEYPYCLEGGAMEPTYIIFRAEKKPHRKFRGYDLWRTIKLE